MAKFEEVFDLTPHETVRLYHAIQSDRVDGATALYGWADKKRWSREDVASAAEKMAEHVTAMGKPELAHKAACTVYNPGTGTFSSGYAISDRYAALFAPSSIGFGAVPEGEVGKDLAKVFPGADVLSTSDYVQIPSIFEVDMYIKKVRAWLYKTGRRMLRFNDPQDAKGRVPIFWPLEVCGPRGSVSIMLNVLYLRNILGAVGNYATAYVCAASAATRPVVFCGETGVIGLVAPSITRVCDTGNIYKRACRRALDDMYGKGRW